MTETMGTPPGEARPSTETATRDVAKDEARGMAQDAIHGGKQTAETAKQQAGEVVGEAANQAKVLFEQAREQVTTQGSDQQQRAASGLRSLADELRSMVDGTSTTEPGLASDLARQASDRARSAADWLESREPADLLDEVRRFARQRPGVFLLSAAAAGFLGGRLTRGLAADAKDDATQNAGYSGSPAAPVTQGAPASDPLSAPTLSTTPVGPSEDAALPEEPTGTPGYSVPPTPGTGPDAQRGGI